MAQTPQQKLNELLLIMDHGPILSYPNKRYLPLLNTINTKKRKISLSKYQEFLDKTDKLGLNPDAIFEDIDEKSSLLREIMKYEKLKTRGGRTPIDQCSNSRIGKTFQSHYYNAKKVLDNQ